MKSRIFVLCCLLLIPVCGLFAQFNISLNRPQISPLSPNAANMQKYVNYPVDYSTGIPQINIPLYEIKIGDLTLPISISYHSAGLKPKEPSGRLGTGWTLNLEPSVIRNIRGIADDRVPTPAGNTIGILHSRYRRYNSTTPRDREKELLRRITDRDWDGESDQYVYDLVTSRGTCYFNDLFPYDEVRMPVHPRNNDIVFGKFGTSLLSGFRIQDPVGNQFRFGDDSNKTEDDGDGNTTRWMCESISSAKTKAKITFNYSRYPVLNPNLYSGMKSMLIIEDSINRTGWGKQAVVTIQTDGYNRYFKFKDNMELESISSYLNNYPTENQYSGNNYINTSEIQEINFGENTVRINYEERRVKSIVVKNAEGAIIRSIEFFATKYNANTTLIKLDSIAISAPGCEQKKYRFKYYAETSVPDIYTKAVDHWGFCNARDRSVYIGGVETVVPTINTKSIVPTSLGELVTREHTITGTDREPDHEWTNTGILTQITDPEGVVTNFEYGGNKGAFLMYYRGSNPQYNQYLHPVGGVRIEKITVSNPTTKQSSWRAFEYGMKAYDDLILKGGGAIKHIVTYRDYSYQFDQAYGNSDGAVNGGSRTRIWGAMPIGNISFNNGSAVIYNIVTELQGSMYESQLLKTVYYYKVKTHLFDDVFLYDSYNSANPKILPLDPDRNYRQMLMVRKDPAKPYDPTDTGIYDGQNDNDYGHLEKTEYFRSDTLIASTEYKYDIKYNGDLFYGVTVSRPYRKVNYVPDPYDTRALEHKIENEQFAELRPGETQWLNGAVKWKALNSEVNKQYDWSVQPVKIISKEKKFEYPEFTPSINPFRIRYNTSDAQRELVDSLSFSPFRGILSYKREKNNLIEKETNVVYDTTFRISKIETKNSFSPGGFEDEIVYHEYSDYGNPVDIASRSGVHTCYIWGYGNQYPVAEIENVTYAQLLTALGKDRQWLTLFSQAGTPTAADMSLINGLRNKLTKSFVKTYTYKPLFGLTSACDENARNIYYEYDGYGRLTLIRDHNNAILKAFCYSFTDQPVDCATGVPASNDPLWIATGNTRCEKGSNNKNTGIVEREERDYNVKSPTYNQLRWVKFDHDYGLCSPV